MQILVNNAFVAKTKTPSEKQKKSDQFKDRGEKTNPTISLLHI